MRRWSWMVSGVVLTVLLGVQETAHASLVDEWLSIGQLVESSSGIFIGKVIDQRSVWDGDRGEICTIATLEVQSELKGRAGDDGLIRIHVPGGHVGSVTEEVSGAPSFSVDETVLVFLKARADGRLEVVGMAQGKYAIHQDAYSGIQFAISDTSGLMRLVADGEATYRAESASVREVLLRDLVEAIEQHINPRLVMR